MTLIKVFFLVALLFSPVGEVRDSATHGAFRTFTECNNRREAIINEPPAGLPDNVGLVCVEVETSVRSVNR
jgi:hypothetical protein